jgi:glycosyltransferase involved in cell wall biosynthesis
MLEEITPVILTFNEEANIRRTLSRLHWAREIVVVDSYSTDSTLKILGEYKNVRLCQRAFDTHANQWKFAVKETGIVSEWVLALDADYVLSDALISELASLRESRDINGYLVSFRYCSLGSPLRGSLYPPIIALYRNRCATYTQDGHTQRVCIEGKTARLNGSIFHDDRKSLLHWIVAQNRYMDLESEILLHEQTPKLSRRVRKWFLVSPFVVFFYCLIVKGGILDGIPGHYYAFQRLIAELLLSLKLMEKRVQSREN